MTSAPPVPVLPFAELLDELRRHGFVIGLDQHLRMQRLLDHLAGECPPDRLKTHLAPIFATSREEQERFHRIFDRIYPVFAEVEREEQERHSGHTAETRVPLRTPARPEWRWWLIGPAVVLLAILLIGLWRWLAPAGETPEPVSQVTTAPNPTPLPTPGVDSLAPVDSIKAEVPLPTLDSVPSPAAETPGQGFLERHRTAIRFILIVMAVIAFLLNEWRLYQRRRLVVSRERRQKPPFAWPVRLESPVNPYAQSADLPNAARLLRQREFGDVARLAVDETVTATIAALGFPTFRYRTDTRAPDYLLLIERSAHRDHAARLYQALGRSLEREGVHVTRYLHDGDPRVCYSENGEQRELLVDLRRRFPDYRVLLFSKGEKLVDQVTGRLHSWTTQFLSWSDRAILTPESPAAWGLREVALAQHFVVLPATTAGLIGVVGHFRGPARPDPNRWRALDQDPATPRLDDGDPLPSLQTYLGPRVYRWLCACAVYPELHWDLTLHFGSLSILGPGLIGEENLLRLLRLPWFRQGAIPDEIRAQLIDELTEAEERAVREAIVELLERNPAPGDSVSANRYELNLVVQRLALHRRDPKERRAAMRDLAGFPRRELVQDFAMLKLIEETPSSRLQVLLPRRLRRVFYRGGVPVLGVRSGIRAAALAAAIAGGLFFTRPRPVESDGEMAIILNGTYGSRTLVVGEQTDVVAIRRIPDSLARYGYNFRTFPDEFTDWSVDRPDILTVDRLGEVVALKPGHAVVSASSGGHQSRLRVRVEPAELAINRDSIDLNPGDVRALKLLVPSQDRELINRAYQGISWSVSDSTLVRVARDGVIEALRPGRTTVTVNAIGRSDSVAVTISGSPVNPLVIADPRRAIDKVLQQYTQAAADGDIDRMVSLFPTMPSVVRAGYDRLGAAHGGIRTKDWKIESASIFRDSARLRMSGSLALFDGGRQVLKKAQIEGISLVQRDDNWLITGIETSADSQAVTREALSLYTRARLFYEQGNSDRAREFAERALTAYPVYTEAEVLLEKLKSGEGGVRTDGEPAVKQLTVEPARLELRPLQSALVSVVAIAADGTERRGDRVGLTVNSTNPGVATAELRPGGVAIFGRIPGTARIQFEAGGAKAWVAVTVGPSPAAGDTGLAREVVRRFDAAIRSGDLASMLKLYPDMPDEIQARYVARFRSGDTVGASGWAEGQLVRRGSAVTIRSSQLAMVRGADGRAGPVRLPRMVTLIPGPETWTIVSLTGEAADLGLNSLVAPMESLTALAARAQVEAAIQRLAGAIGEGDLKALESVFPTMPEEMHRGYAGMFKAQWTLDTRSWRTLGTRITGDSALVLLTGTTRMVDDRRRPRNEIAWPREIRLRRQDDGWRIVSLGEEGLLLDPTRSWSEAAPDSAPGPAPVDSARPATPGNVPRAALTAYSRAVMAELRDSLQEASDSYREALRIYPDYAEALEGLTKVAIRQRLNDWTKHLEGRNLAGLLQLYPGMPERDQQAWKRLLENPSVTKLSVTTQDAKVELTGEGTATVRYGLVYTVDSRPGGRSHSVSRYQTTFALVRGAWQITSMRGVP